MKPAHLKFAALITLIIGTTVCPLAAKEFVPLKGQARITPGKDKNSPPELGLILKGEIAKAVYLQLPFPEKEDLCTGGYRKSDVNGLFCLTDQLRTEYKCSLGYLIGTNKVTSGPLTC